MTETSFLLIVPFLASMTDIPCCRVPAQLSMAYKEISPFPASLALRCGALPAIAQERRARRLGCEPRRAPQRRYLAIEVTRHQVGFDGRPSA